MDPVLDFDPCKVIRRKKYITPEEIVAMFYEKSENEYVIIFFKDCEVVDEINVTETWIGSKSISEIDAIMDATISRMSGSHPW